MIAWLILGIIAVIIIDYIDWNRVFWWKKTTTTKEKKKSRIRWEVVWGIIFLICIAIAASLD